MPTTPDTTEAIPDTLRIRVYDALTNKPVEFCNIIAKNIPTGALADDEGKAALRIGPRTLRDTISVSSVGYERKLVAMAQEMARIDTLRIYLTPKEYPLSEVTVRPPRKTKVLKKGKRHGGGLAKSATRFKRGDCVAWDAGSKGKRIWLTAVGMQSFPGPEPKVSKDSFSSDDAGIWPVALRKMRMRINVYDASSKETAHHGLERRGYTNTLQRPVIFTYEWSKVVDNWFVHTFPEPILLPEKALVEIEMLDDMPENELIFFKCNVFGRGVMSRDVNDRDWIKLPIAVPFTLTFIEEKM